MTQRLSNQNYIEHYRLDAEFADYFTPSPAERENIRRRYQFFRRQLRPKAGHTILEIGSGGGEALNIIPENATYIPLDLSHKNLAEIRRRASGRVVPAFADGLNLPFSDGSFDIVIISEVLEHLTEPPRALQEIERVLKTGGKVIVSVPYREKITYHICIHCNQPTPTNAHLHSFDENSLTGLLREAGLKPVTPKLLGNKLLAVMRYPQISRHFPYGLWRFFDKGLNLLLPKATHMALMAKR